MFEHTAKGHLSAVALTETAMEELRNALGPEGSYTWQAEVGICDDWLGRRNSASCQTVTDWQELKELLSQMPHINHLTLTVESGDDGIIAIAFRNQPPAGGSYVITGRQAEWVQGIRLAIQALFGKLSDRQTARLYNRWVFGAIQTALPLSLACIIVLVVAAIAVPADWVRDGYLWWVTACTLVATLWLGNYISDRMLLYVITRFPYLRWEQ